MGAESSIGACSIGGESCAMTAKGPLRGAAAFAHELMIAAAEPATALMNAHRLIRASNSPTSA